MRQIVVAALFLVASFPAGAALVDMPFWDAGGTKYTTANYVQEMQESFPGVRPLLLLVVTRSANEPEFKKQMTTLRRLDSEELQLLYVVGSATSTDEHSYWLASEDAAALLEGGEHFLLLAIANGGEVCLSSKVALKRKQIVASNNALQPTFLRCAQKRG